jgi:hypothetical protein
MDILPTINPGAGATTGGADSQQKASRTSGDGSFADMLSSANAAGKTKPAKGAADRHASSKAAKGAAEGMTESVETHRGAGRKAAHAAAKGGNGQSAANGGGQSTANDSGTPAATDATAGQGTGTATDTSTANTFSAGLAGAMYNTIVSSAAATKPTTPITDAVLAGGTVGSGTKPLPGAQTQTAAGTAPATADAEAGNTAQSAGGAATANATATGTGTSGATGANLVMTPDGEPIDTAAAATLAAAAQNGKSAPGKAESLVTGSSDVVAAKTAIRTNAIDPTTTGKDAKTATAAGANSTSKDPAAPSLANGGDANGTNAARPANLAGADPAAAVRSQRSDAAKADPAATTGAAATPADAGTTPATAGTSTTAATVGGTEATTTTHHAAHAGATRAMPGPVPAFDQIALSVNRAAADGLDRITIQLKPESLGRVDVHLQLGHDGRMTATFVADRQDTLDMLQRDARGLERALNDAGLRTDTGGLSFNLRGDGREFGNSSQNMAQGTDDNAGGDAGETETTAEATRPGRAVDGLLDISV